MSLSAFALLGRPDVTDLEGGQAAIRSGLATESIRLLAERYRVSLEQMGRLIGIPRATLARKLRAKSRLGAPEADRAYRLAELFAIARDVFEDDRSAQAWFAQPNRALGGSNPIDLLDNTIGIQRVQRVLDQIESSVIS